MRAMNINIMIIRYSQRPPIAWIMYILCILWDRYCAHFYELTGKSQRYTLVNMYTLKHVQSISFDQRPFKIAALSSASSMCAKSSTAEEEEDEDRREAGREAGRPAPDAGLNEYWRWINWRASDKTVAVWHHYLLESNVCPSFAISLWNEL